MKITIIGASGQLGNFLLNSMKNHILVALTRKDVDLSSKKSIKERIKNSDVIINCAAFTDTKLAEYNDDNFNVNYRAVKKMSKASGNSLFIHISTQ